MLKTKRLNQGVTLIELMVAMVIGMIVIVATLGLFSRTLSSNAYQAKVLKVQGFLLNSMKMITRDLRRAGYTHWTSSQTLAGYASMTQPLLVLTGNDQVTFAYDLDSVGGSDNFGFRYNAGAKTLQTCTGACDSTSWVALNDANDIQVDGFTVTQIGSETFTFASQTSVVREFQIQLTASIQGDMETARTATEVVRMRRNEPLAP